jgi:hypothetical protein
MFLVCPDGSTGRLVATGKYTYEAMDSFLNLELLLGAVLTCVWVDRGLQWRAKTNLTVVGGVSAHALVLGDSEHIHIPAVQEITVEAVASCVTLRKHEYAAILLRSHVEKVNDLEEQLGQLYWMIRKAHTIIHAREIGHMRLITPVQVFAVST